MRLDSRAGGILWGIQDGKNWNSVELHFLGFIVSTAKYMHVRVCVNIVGIIADTLKSAMSQSAMGKSSALIIQETQAT